MPNIGPIELVLILAIALLVFGAGRVSQLGSAMGQAVREFRHASAQAVETTVDAKPERSTSIVPPDDQGG